MLTTLAVVLLMDLLRAPGLCTDGRKSSFILELCHTMDTWIAEQDLSSKNTDM